MSATAGRRFLDLRAMASLEHLRFTTKNRIEGSFGGRHRSRKLGGAGEFVDFRDYSAGEDLRRLDWKVLARTGKTYIRLHQDETNVRGMLVIDSSQSMTFGATSPRSTAGGPRGSRASPRARRGGRPAARGSRRWGRRPCR